MGQSYDQIYERFFSVPPPGRVEYHDSNAGILRYARGFIEGFDLTMQTPVGCPGGSPLARIANFAVGCLWNCHERHTT